MEMEQQGNDDLQAEGKLPFNSNTMGWSPQKIFSTKRLTYLELTFEKDSQGPTLGPCKSIFVATNAPNNNVGNVLQGCQVVDHARLSGNGGLQLAKDNMARG
jgi:hypothetical protein